MIQGITVIPSTILLESIFLLLSQMYGIILSPKNSTIFSEFFTKISISIPNEIYIMQNNILHFYYDKWLLHPQYFGDNHFFL